jgi:RNA polymerase sigma-70 factor (ECF subfamily)
LLQKNYPAQADRAKGKFRSFLLLTLNHFLADEHAKATAQKRDGGQTFISLDEESPEDRYRLEPADAHSPEKLFELRWGTCRLVCRWEDRHMAQIPIHFVRDTGRPGGRTGCRS